jgi:hypothetical protein
VDRPTIHRDPAVDTHPHACWSGLVYLTYTAYDEAVGEEVERLEVVPCRRCAELPAER